jgi:hypothetical protein
MHPSRGRLSWIYALAAAVTLAWGTWVGRLDRASALAVPGPQSAAEQSADGQSPGELPSRSASPPAATAGRQTYAAQLGPINGSRASGAARFVIEGGRIGAFLEVVGLDPAITPPVHLYRGDRCPSLDDDRNADGLVDSEESVRATGEPVLPLVLGELDAASRGPFPATSADGRLSYAASGPSDESALDRFVVVIRGIGPARQAQLPETAQGPLPVACGVLLSVEN